MTILRDYELDDALADQCDPGGNTHEGEYTILLSNEKIWVTKIRMFLWMICRKDYAGYPEFDGYHGREPRL